MSGTEAPHWLAEVTAQDLHLVGLDAPENDRSAQLALLDWAREYDVDLDRVHDCLLFLQSGPHLLLASSPLALMAYSPRRATFRASFDLDFPEGLAEAGMARAGVWLTVLASELGELPTAPGHWLAATMRTSGLSGQNVGILAWVQKYASELRLPGEAQHGPALTDYDRRMASAIWRFAAYALR
jgi:hypothetical protein